jgi:hypothetical protein
MKYPIKKTVCHLVPAILLTSVLVGCGGDSSPAAATTGTVTVNMTGSSATDSKIINPGFFLATFSSGQAVDPSTFVGQWIGSFSGSLVSMMAEEINSPPAIFEAGNYGLIPAAPDPDICRVANLTNATADKSAFYSGVDDNKFTSGKDSFPIIPITLTGGDATIDIVCNTRPI